MIRRPPRSTRTDTLFPYTTLFRSTFIDTKTLVLDLRAGVKFHDGTPLDAEAVRFNLERARTGDRSNVKAGFSGIESIESTGPLQVTLRLKAPDISLPGVLSDRAGMMVSPKAATSSEERRVGKECVRQCRSRWSP